MPYNPPTIGQPEWGDELNETLEHLNTTKSDTAHTHTQAQSHNSPDTDSATTALHHTLGTGANQAAAGDHNHDTRYYTETEVDTALAGKSNVGHTHTGLEPVVDIFTANGTWTVPAGTVLCKVILCAGGGGGGGGSWSSTTGPAGGGGGGGGGAWTENFWVPTLSSYQVFVGSGGNGGAAATAPGLNGSHGSAGGDTYINNTIFGVGSGVGGWRGEVAAAGAGGSGGQPWNASALYSGGDGGQGGFEVNGTAAPDTAILGCAGAGGGGGRKTDGTDSFGGSGDAANGTAEAGEVGSPGFADIPTGPGAGGWGGNAATSSQTPTAGTNGGAGYAIIISYRE